MEREQLHRLIDGLLAGELSPSEMAELEAALAGSEEARTAYLRAMWNESLLRGALCRVRGSRSARRLVTRRLHGSRRRRRVARYGWIATAAAALLLIGLGVTWLGSADAPAPGPHVESVRVLTLLGHVSLKRADGLARSVERGGLIESGSTVHMAEEDSLKTQYSDGTHVTFSGCDFEIPGEGEGKVLVLHRGRLDADVRPQPQQRPFRVKTPWATVTVTGTRFSLTAASESTRLDVERGVVEIVSNAGRSALVHASESAVAGRDGRVRMEGVPRPMEVRGFALVDADQDRDVPQHTPLLDGAVVSRRNLPAADLNVRILFTGTPSSVQVELKGPVLFSGIERNPPFLVFGNEDGDILGRQLPPGEYVVTVTPCGDDDGRHPVGPSSTLRFSIVDAGE